MWWGTGGRWDAPPEMIWPMSVRTFDRMRRESQVAAMIDAVILPVLSAGWHIDPDGADPKVVALVADDLGLPVRDGEDREAPTRDRDRFDFAEHLRLVMTMVVFGHSFFEPVYRFEGGRAHLHKAAWRPPWTISKIEVARDGGLVAIEQNPSAGFKASRMLTKDLLCYVNRREGGDWFGQSYLERAYKYYLIKEELLRIKVLVDQRNGMGVPTYTTSAPLEGETPEKAREETQKEIDAAKEIVRKIRAGDEAGVSIPSGARFDLKGVDGRIPDILKDIEYCDQQIAAAFLAHFLNLGQQSGTGSYALGVTFADFFVQTLQALAQQVAEVANRHLVEDLVDLNFGPKTRAPKVAFDDIGSRHPVVAEAIYQLVMCGAILPEPNLETFLRNLYGIPEPLPRDKWPYPPKRDAATDYSNTVKGAKAP
jgi:hypothetical protein